MGVRSSLPPHIYAISDSAFQCMLRNAANQCCVVSGESGAGLYCEHSLIVVRFNKKRTMDLSCFYHSSDSHSEGCPYMKESFGGL